MVERKGIRTKRLGRFGALASLTVLLVQTGLTAGADRSISVRKEAGGGAQTRFSMEFRGADVRDVLRAIGQENHLNFIIAEDVKGQLTLSFQNVALRDALNAILKINNLMSLEEDGIIRVFNSPFKEGEGNLITRMISINFNDVKESQDSVKGLLSRQGAISVDPRTNTLIVRDVPENVGRIEEILKKLDTRTPQVLIEARIVEASTNFARELGVQWGGSYRGSASKGNYQVTGPLLDTGTQAGGGQSGIQGPRPLTGGRGISGNDFAVNLPASIGPGLGGGLGFSFGSLNNKVQLDLQLSALEDSGHGRILSNPRILTLDNKEAKISAGTEILVPVSTIFSGTTGASGSTSTSGTSSGSANTTTTGVTTINAKLELTVTPHVTSENLIVMRVKADKKEPDYNREVQDIPPLTTRTAETDLLVKNGDTIVIGGVFTRNESFSEQGVPWLSKIPVLGWLFKKRTKQDIQSELLIFITPTIMDQEE